MQGRPFNPKEECGKDEQSMNGTSSDVLDSSCKTPPPEFGGYDCEFVNPPDPKILQTECSICQQVLREPQQNADCGHIFCKTCIGRVQAIKKPCPECNTGLNTFPNRSLQRTLNQLQVRCTYQNVGCDWTGELGELEKHLLAGCSIPCEFSYAGCTVRMTRKDTVTHMKEDQTHHIKLLAKKVKEQNRKLEEQNRQIEELNMKLKSKDEVIEAMTRKMKKEHATKLHSKDEERAEKQAFTSEPLQLIMNEFEHRKNNNRDWFSEPFYTHPQGYRMCVHIYPNGFGNERGTHVSLFTHIMKGEFDDQLSWPFEGKITVELLNQNAENDHHMHEFSYDKDCKHGHRVTIGEKNYGLGLDVISHSELNQDSDSKVQYLKDDCLKFRLYCTVYQ